jgi:hypothetical protein
MAIATILVNRDTRMREAEIEQYLVRRIEELGGITAKMTVDGRRGWPDRLVCLHGGRISLVELKRPKGGQLSATQEKLFGLLRSLGTPVWVLRTYEDIDKVFGPPGSIEHDR